MRILIDINHPAQVHLFKNFIWEMQKVNNEVLVSVSKKDVAIELLEKYDIPHIIVGKYGDTLVKKIIGTPIISFNLWLKTRRFQPNVILALGSIRAGHLAFFTHVPYIAFDDDEYSYPYYHIFATRIYGFSGFKLSGRKIKIINSFKEMAYLRPDKFKPDLAVIEKIGLKPGYILMRFTGWTAFHDTGMSGISDGKKIEYIKKLSAYAPVYISSEKKLSNELEKYRLNIAPENLHHVLAFAKLLISDSQTMTTEAAVLGVPAIRSNSFVGSNDMRNFLQLEQIWGLIFNIRDQNDALMKAIELLQTENLSALWDVKRKNLLSKTMDPTMVMIDCIDEIVSQGLS